MLIIAKIELVVGRNNVPQRLVRALTNVFGTFAIFAAVLLGYGARIAQAADGVVLELVEIVPDRETTQWPSVRDGYIKGADPYYANTYTSEHSWNSPPKTISPGGFSLTLNTKAENKTGGGITSGTQVNGSAFEFDVAEAVAWARVPVGAPGSASGSQNVNIKPRGIGVGSTVELRIGASWGAGVTYKYRGVASGSGGGNGNGGNGGAGGDNRKLAAHLNCPLSIVISALPSLNCHIVVTNWRYSADPVQVILPNALDAYGNHANGIQLLQAAGSQNVYSWSYPNPYNWGMFVFACPAQQGTGANCFGSVTPPGGQEVNIIVRQGSDEVRLRLLIEAIARPGRGGGGGGRQSACGFNLGAQIFAKWQQMGGQQGPLGCPTGNEQTASSLVSRAQMLTANFAGGYILHHLSGRFAGQTFEVHGSIAAAFASGHGSWLGVPISDEYDVAGGRRSDFENGYIVWDRLTGGSIALRDGSRTVSVEHGTDRGGGDFANFDVVGDSMEICRDACAANSSCAAFTFVRPGVQGPRGRCWLKSSVPASSRNGCCVSGVKHSR
jgi:hypothetical protein